MELPIERNEDGIGFASLQLLQDELAKSQQLVAAAFASAVHGDRAKPWQAKQRSLLFFVFDRFILVYFLFILFALLAFLFTVCTFVPNTV